MVFLLRSGPMSCAVSLRIKSRLAKLPKIMGCLMRPCAVLFRHVVKSRHSWMALRYFLLIDILSQGGEEPGSAVQALACSLGTIPSPFYGGVAHSPTRQNRFIHTSRAQQ